jgi:hypothetical protein
MKTNIYLGPWKESDKNSIYAYPQYYFRPILTPKFITTRGSNFRYKIVCPSFIWRDRSAIQYLIKLQDDKLIKKGWAGYKVVFLSQEQFDKLSTLI